MTRHRISTFASVVVTALIAFAIATPAHARPRPATQSSFEANKDFGLGLMVGAPSGLAGKVYLSSDTALDFGVGVYHEFRYHDGIHAHMDFLWHPAVLAKADPFWLPIYFGVGGRVLDHDDYRDDYNDGTHIGIRGPIGIMMDFNNVPLDIFLELALVADVIVDNDHKYVDLSGALGIRYYF